MWTAHPRTRLFLGTFILVHTSQCGSRCRTTCLHKTCSSTCHHMSERLLFPRFCLLPLSLVPLLSLSLLPVLCPEPLCGRERRALNPMRTRKMRSIAPSHERHGENLRLRIKTASLVKNYPGIIVRQRHTDRKQMGLLRERCAE